MLDPASFLVNSWLPEGQAGPWVVRRFMENNVQHTCLCREAEWWMDDLPKEFRDSRSILEAAAGSIVITGLGLGAVPAWLCRLERVTEIHIVERDQQVIDLVWPHLSMLSDKLKLITCDAREFSPPYWFGGYDFAWHDIWLDSRKPECQAEITALKVRYADFCRQQLVWVPS